MYFSIGMVMAKYVKLIHSMFYNERFITNTSLFHDIHDFHGILINTPLNDTGQETFSKIT